MPKPPTYGIQPQAPYQPPNQGFSGFDFGTSGLYADQFQALQDQFGQQQNWANYVYDQWLPEQMGSGGGPNLGAFRGLLASPNAGEQRAATDLFNAYASVPDFGSEFASRGDMAQAQFLSGAYKDYWDQLAQLQAQRSQSLQQLAMAVAGGELDPAQAQALGSNLYGFAPQELGYFGQIAPASAQGGLDPEDLLTISQEAVKGLSEFRPQNAPSYQAAPAQQQQGIAAGTVRQKLMAAYAPLGNPQEVEQAINDAIARYYGQEGGGPQPALAAQNAPPAQGMGGFAGLTGPAFAGGAFGAGLAALLRRLRGVNPAGLVRPGMEPFRMGAGGLRPPRGAYGPLPRNFGTGLGPRGFGLGAFGMGGHVYGQK